MTYRGEWKPFLERLATDLKATQPVRGSIDREIRIQGYMQCEFGHINFYLARPEMELSRGFCDFALFPERTYFGDVKHSYLVELKSSKAEEQRGQTPNAPEEDRARSGGRKEGRTQIPNHSNNQNVRGLSMSSERKARGRCCKPDRQPDLSSGLHRTHSPRLRQEAA